MAIPATRPNESGRAFYRRKKHHFFVFTPHDQRAHTNQISTTPLAYPPLDIHISLRLLLVELLLSLFLLLLLLVSVVWWWLR